MSEHLVNIALVVLEAMKVEHQITAPWDGVVREIRCREGELAQRGSDLMAIDEKESG